MNRRDFFRRTAPMAALAVVGAPAVASLIAQPKRDTAGRLIVDGKEVHLSEADIAGGLHITAGHATIRECHFDVGQATTAVTVRNT